MTTAAVNRSVIDVRACKVWAARILFFGLIAGIFSLRFPLPVLAALAVSALVFGSMACVRSIHPVCICVLVNFLYWTVSGLLSRGIHLQSLHSAEFWRGEGRCFFFYLPLLAVSMLSVSKSDLRFLVRLVGGLTIVGTVLGLLWLMGLGHLFQATEGEEGEVIDSIYFIGLLTSHTGAGAFWATVAAFLIGYSWVDRSRFYQVLAVLAACLTLATGGRAATLGLIAALGWMLVRGELLNRRTLLIGSLAILVSVAGSVFVALKVPEISERMGEVFSSRAIRSVTAAAEEPTLENAAGFFHSGAGLDHHNLVIRVYLWKYALHLFRQSPVTGIGFGRFNDCYLRFAGIPYVAMLAVEGERYAGSGIRWEGEQLMTSTGNAHNSYLHMLSETGLIGLVLFVVLWGKMYCATTPSPVSDSFERAYAIGCQAMIICLLIGALAGHALGAPSGGILLTTLVGAWLSRSRSQVSATNA